LKENDFQSFSSPKIYNKPIKKIVTLTETETFLSFLLPNYQIFFEKVTRSQALKLLFRNIRPHTLITKTNFGMIMMKLLLVVTSMALLQQLQL